MAYVNTLVKRNCDPGAFERIENAVADCVGAIVYGDKYPGEADVDVFVAHAHLATYMALKVEIDTEDLPQSGWRITENGLCVREELLEAPELFQSIPQQGLTDEQRNQHFAVQARLICNRVVEHPLWNTLKFGWKSAGIDHTKRLGVLVARAEGAWHATYTEQEEEK